MDDQYIQSGAILFLVGLPILIFLQWKLGFLTGKVAHHQSRNLYALICGTFFVAVFLLMFRPDVRELASSVVLALALALPASWWLHRYYGKRLRGHELSVARRSDIKQVAMVAGTVLGIMLFGRTPVGKEIMEVHWLVLGLAMAWPLTTAYAYFHISRLEHSMGNTIEESPPND
jgi:hypothetical protein